MHDEGERLAGIADDKRHLNVIAFMSIIDFLLGRPIPTSEERALEIGITKGIPILGLDALSSAAYGPEAALTRLVPLGVAGLTYIVP